MRRVAFPILLAASSLSPCGVQSAPHSYSVEERYAGCLFGDMVPLLRRGYSRDGAMATASRRCESLSAGMTRHQVENAADFVNFSIDLMER